MSLHKVLFHDGNKVVKEFRSWDRDFKEWKDFETKGCTARIKIMQDETPSNPREEWDNAGTIVSVSRRDFHTDNGASPLKVAVKERDLSGQFYYELEELDGSNVKGEVGFYHVDGERQKVCVLPIYMYSHSGDTIRTTPFGCRWDSGLVGYIYMTAEKAKEEGWTKGKGVDWKRVREYLVGEVKVFDQYITGDIYGFSLNPINPITGEVDEIEEDSCWGFFGDDEKENGMVDHWSILKIDSNLEFDLCEAT